MTSQCQPIGEARPLHSQPVPPPVVEVVIPDSIPAANAQGDAATGIDAEEFWRRLGL